MNSASLMLMASATIATSPVEPLDDGRIYQAVRQVGIGISEFGNNQGNLVLRLEVDTAGKVTGCFEASASFGGLYRIDEILTRLCPSLKKRFLFVPARNAENEKVPSRYWIGVRFSFAESGAIKKKIPLKFELVSQNPEDHGYPSAVENQMALPTVAINTGMKVLPPAIDPAVIPTTGVSVSTFSDDKNVRPFVPIGDPATWLNDWEVPSGAVPPGSYFANVLIAFGPKGVPYRCEFTKPFGQDALDQLACTLLLRRVRFFPARDARHAASGGHWVGQFRWVVPVAAEKQ